MPRTLCHNCGQDYSWNWEEAFDKFGFGDGDGQVMTEHVAESLRKKGYEVTTTIWGLHNTLIVSIKRDGKELIPEAADVGYANPRDYLPADVVALLDDKLPAEGETVS